MFIYNFKLNGSKLFKFIFAIIIVIVLVLCGIVSYKLYNASIRVDDGIKQNDVVELTNENYSTILKTVHDDIDTYIGQKIKFTGFVYRV